MRLDHPNDLPNMVDNDSMFPHVKDLPWTLLKLAAYAVIIKWLMSGDNNKQPKNPAEMWDKDGEGKDQLLFFKNLVVELTT